MHPRTPEETLIDVLRTFWVRHPDQLNEAFTADAELIRIGENLCLACTTDTLHEEITLKILENPWTIGWTSVVINLSDLAAVGAEPKGLLLAWTIPQSLHVSVTKEIARGVHDAVTAHKTALLGGDVNSGGELQICGSAFGIVPDGNARQRVGMKPGDRIFVTGPLGIGNALGFSKLQKLEDAAQIEDHYRPMARFNAGSIIRELASASLDTSDGLLAGLDTLTRLNQCGAVFRHLPGLYHPDARSLAARFHIPLWLFAAAEHGEFELLFSIPESRVQECRRRAGTFGLDLLEIGEAVEQPGLVIQSASQRVPIDRSEWSGDSNDVREDPGAYVQSLLAYARHISIKD